EAWQPLLDAAEAAESGSTDPGAQFDLRTPPSPELADLSATTAAVAWYTADLADDGGDLDPVVAQIAAVVTRIRALRDGAKVVVVAHSTAGVAARAFTAAHPDDVAGLITLGTPHGAAPLTALDDPTQSDSVRLASRLLAAAGATSPVRDAVDHLLAAAEGWLPTTPLPTPLAYPRARFAGGTDHGTGGLPAGASAGQLSEDREPALGAALAQALGGAPTGDDPPTRDGASAPADLGVGLRIGPAPVAPEPGGVVVDAGL